MAGRQTPGSSRSSRVPRAAGRPAAGAVAPLERLALDTPIGASGLPGATALRRVGGRLGVATVRDLLFYLPRDHQDLRQHRTAAQLRDVDEGTTASARLEVADVQVKPGFRRRPQRTVASLRDSSGEVEAVWFGRQYVERRLFVGQTLVFSGKVAHRSWRTSLQNPDFEAEGDTPVHAGGMRPVYRLTEGLTARRLRAAMRAALDRVGPYPEYLAEALRGPRVGIDRALEMAHFPPDPGAWDGAVERLAWDELLALQVGMVARQRARGRSQTRPDGGRDEPPGGRPAPAWKRSSKALGAAARRTRMPRRSRPSG